MVGFSFVPGEPRRYAAFDLSLINPMWLFSFVVLLVVFPAGIVAVGLLTRTHSRYMTLVCGAFFGVAIYCMTLLVLRDFEVAVEESEAGSHEYHWACQALGTPVLAALSALATRIGAEFLVD